MQAIYAEAKLARAAGWFSRRHQSRAAHDSAREKWEAEHPHRGFLARSGRRAKARAKKKAA